MIAKTKIPSSFKSIVDYALSKGEDAKVLSEVGLLGNENSDYIKQFERLAEVNQRCTKPAMHHILGFDTADNLSVEQMKQLADEFCERLGYEQHLCVLHQDTQNPHIHIIANRVKFEGKVIANNFSKSKAKEVARAMEKDHKLTIASEKKQTAERNLKTEENKPKAKQNAKQLERNAIYSHFKAYLSNDKKDLRGFVEFMAENGVKTLVSKNKSGINGLSFQIEGSEQKHKASLIHSSLKWSKLGVTLGEVKPPSIIQKSTPSKSLGDLLKGANFDSGSSSILTPIAPIVGGMSEADEDELEKKRKKKKRGYTR